MSTNQSDRAGGRVGDLRASALDRLRGHAELVALLERVDSVTDGASVIVPTPRLGMLNRSDTEEPPDVALGIGVVTGSSERENHHERKHLVVQSTVQLREQTLRGHGNAWFDDVTDEVSAVLTSHASPWIARGESGGFFEPVWDPDIGRYVQVQQFDVQSHG